MPIWIENLLSATWFGYLARIVLTFMFWASGVAKLIGFDTGVAEMQHFGLEPAWLYNLATIIVQLGGSILIIANRWTWLGAGALAVFTALTIPIAHNFWALPEPQATMEFYVVMEHISVIGSLMVVAYASIRKSWKQPTAKGRAAFPSNVICDATIGAYDDASLVVLPAIKRLKENITLSPGEWSRRRCLALWQTRPILRRSAACWTSIAPSISLSRSATAMNARDVFWRFFPSA